MIHRTDAWTSLQIIAVVTTSMKRFIHAVLCLTAVPLWIISMLLLYVAGTLAIKADKVWPEADWGNCWTKAIPLWWERGGYLNARKSDDVKVFNFFYLPHVMWVPTWNEDTEVVQTEPLDRRKGSWLPWYTVHFKYYLVNKETPHNGTPL